MSLTSEVEPSRGFRISRTTDFSESSIKVVSSTFSDPTRVSTGLYFGPTLFSLFMAGMEKMIASCNIDLFADDVVIWKSYEDTTKIENSLNENLVAVQCFAK
ncbi:hypothetical protein AVEN_98883-1 [Araneus ventricosus]|uniref:Reverse transcriptase domain-containing protein n=1 Tax=Araneus ventricosus TaxID=182803 RepID=A0A4Y2FWZ3_ARAVE|nr:hypothetical protein AVEN_98883-1 [Araneus ventricosus]